MCEASGLPQGSTVQISCIKRVNHEVLSLFWPNKLLCILFYDAPACICIMMSLLSCLDDRAAFMSIKKSTVTCLITWVALPRPKSLQVCMQLTARFWLLIINSSAIMSSRACTCQALTCHGGCNKWVKSGLLCLSGSTLREKYVFSHWRQSMWLFMPCCLWLNIHHQEHVGTFIINFQPILRENRYVKVPIQARNEKIKIFVGTVISRFKDTCYKDDLVARTKKLKWITTFSPGLSTDHLM